MGGRGSGRSRKATDAVELLFAAVARGDSDSVAKCVAKIDVAKRHGASMMTGARVSRLMQQACSKLMFDASEAVANPPEHLGDICVSLRSGKRVWIEVKGQTKKKEFAAITQADYVRDGTDFLRRYANVNPTFDRLISGQLRRDLALDDALTFTADWDLADLWMADLALLESESKKMRANVRTPADLTRFMNEKYLVHLSMEGVRYLKISELRPVIALHSGDEIKIELDTASSSKVAAIRVAAGITPRHSTTDFTYHIGYKTSQAAGRHKLHNIALSMSPHLVVIR